MTTLSIILSSTITALIVSVFYSKFFMKQQEKWMNKFFEEEEALIKKYCRDLSGFKKIEDGNPYKDGTCQTTKQFTDMLLGRLLCQDFGQKKTNTFQNNFQSYSF